MVPLFLGHDLTGMTECIQLRSKGTANSELGQAPGLCQEMQRQGAFSFSSIGWLRHILKRVIILTLPIFANRE
jgi:hypothetical protein